MHGRFERPANPNEVIRRLLWMQCRLVENEDDDTIARDLGAARRHAERVVDAAVVELLLRAEERQMRSCALNRHADRKNPLVLLGNLLTWPAQKADRLHREVQAIFDEELAPLLGGEQAVSEARPAGWWRVNDERGKAIWLVMMYTAWGEQNMRDWDGAQGGAITGTAKGYLGMSESDKAVVEDNWRKMGFDRPQRSAPAA